MYNTCCKILLVQPGLFEQVKKYMYIIIEKSDNLVAFDGTVLSIDVSFDKRQK